MAEEKTEKSPKPLPIASTSANQETALKRLLGEQPQRPDKNQARVDALIGVASIDLALQKLLAKALVPSLHDSDELLAEGKPIGSLMLRAKLACRLGLVSHDLYAVIKSLSQIRNISAHEEQRVSIFDKDVVKQLITNTWDRIDSDFKEGIGRTVEERFNGICSLVRVSLILATNQITVVQYGQKEVMFI